MLAQPKPGGGPPGVAIVHSDADVVHVASLFLAWLREHGEARPLTTRRTWTLFLEFCEASDTEPPGRARLLTAFAELPGVTHTVHRDPAIIARFDEGNHPVIAALLAADRPLSNRELAMAMRCSEGEATKRVSEVGYLIRRERNGRERRLSLANLLPGCIRQLSRAA